MMGMMDAVTKRGPGRPRKVEMSPVAEALARPLPANAQAALDKFNAVFAAWEKAARLAQEAFSAGGRVQLTAELERARNQLAKARVAVETDDPDAPSDEDIAALEQRVAELKNNADDGGSRLKAFQDMEEKRYAELSLAYEEYQLVVAQWTKPIEEAAAEQMQAAANAIEEAVAAVGQTRTWSSGGAPYALNSLPNYAGGERIYGSADVTVPDEVLPLLTTARRYNRLRRPQFFTGATPLSGRLDRT